MEHARNGLIALALGATLWTGLPAAVAAENVVLVSGAFRRSIPVSEFETLATTGQATGLLGNLLTLARQQPSALARLLNESMQLPVVLVSRLSNTRIGDAVLLRVARIVYPLKAPAVGLPALRSALVMGLVEGNGSISAVSFLKAYPTANIEVNIPALLTLLQKTSSIAQLVRFFSESPLDGLRGETTPAAPDRTPSPKPAPGATAPPVSPTIRP
ncbi:MAG: alpha/beta hydrolase [Synechococcaceae cyanobacterium]